jgi:hypothetical protein
MKSVVRWAKAVSAIVGAIMAAAALMGMVNQALLDHLDKVFVTKQEFQVGHEAIMKKLEQLEHRKK